MSNVGQAALIVVGTVVGAYFGSPQLGFVLGSLAGSMLFPTMLPPGPQISSNRTTTSALGDPVPLVFGTAAVAGTVIWLAPVVSSSSSTKSGPQQQTFSYTQSIAIGLCERVDDTASDNVGAIGGLTRVWENGAIVYDIRPQLQFNSDLDQLAETDEEYATRLQVSAVYAETFTLYLGDELQEADPTIEAVQGAGQVPGFRGLAYIVYPNRSLQEAQAFRHPNFQFEVYANGIGSCVDTPQSSNEVLYPWVGGDGTGDPSNSLNINTYQIVGFDDQLPQYVADMTYWGTAIFTTAAAAVSVVEGYCGAALDQFVGYYAGSPGPDGGGSYPTVSRTGAAVCSGQQSISPDPAMVLMQYTFQATNVFVTKAQHTSPGVAFTPIGARIYSDEGGSGDDAQGLIYFVSGPATDARGPPYGPTYPPFPYPPWIAPFQTGSTGSIAPGSGVPGVYPENWYQSSQSTAIMAMRAPNKPPDPCYGLPPSLQIGYSVLPDGQIVLCGDWTYDTSRTFKVLQTYNRGGASSSFDTTLYYPLNPCLPTTDPNYDNETFWTAAYDEAVTKGYMPAGLTYYPGGSAVGYPVVQSWAWIIDLTICEGAGGEATLADIIAAVCKRAGLLAIDVEDMASVQVAGYSVSDICSGTDILTPLRSIGFFDAIESGDVLRFQARGKPIVATLTTDDIGAYDPGSNSDDGSSTSNIPPSVTTARAQDEDLPHMIRLRYKATSRDYEDGEQNSPFRFSSLGVNLVDVSLPVCMGDTQALQCASVLWADAWAARTTYQIAVDQSWSALEVGDCIGAPVDGVIQRMRIVSETNSSGVLRKLSMVADDGGAYISYAVASAPLRPPQKLTFVSPTAYRMLDLPMLQESDNDAGFYVAVEPTNFASATWNGCVIYKSVDGGATFAAAITDTVAAAGGTIQSAVPASQAFTWDEYTTITVNVADSSITFESLTDDAVLAGSNAACMGMDGRWEIVQFANAEQLTSTQWQLSRLLRGRRGTEHVIGSSHAGDIFVVLTPTTLARIILQSTEIGASRVYKGVSVGASYYGTGTDETFTGYGVALIPFSPCSPAAERTTDGDILISWTRRSRFGQTMMSGVDIPLGETSEAFQVDIVEEHSPSSPATVLRTLTSSTTSVRYSHANQESDFGSPLPSTLKVAIYQMSSVVGRGTPIIATLTVEE
jgi:hypothetical protein